MASERRIQDKTPMIALSKRPHGNAIDIGDN